MFLEKFPYRVKFYTKGIGHTFGVRVDGAAPRGLWPPAGGGLCRRVVKGTVLKIDWPFRARGFLSLTAFQAEGCGIALTGDEHKVSVTDLLSVSYGMICILVISRCAAPPLSGCAGLPPKGETTHYDLCVALLLQIMFAVHARGASNFSPLRTFGPADRQPSSPIGACPYGALHNPQRHSRCQT